MLTRIDHAHVVDVVAGMVHEDRSVTIDEQGTIVAVDPSGDASASGSALDADGRYLVPGLIDCHVHLFRNGGADPRGDYMRASDGERIRLATANARAALEHGVTTVRDLASPAEPMRDLVRAIEDGTVPGPRILWTGAAVTRPGGDDHYFGGEVESPDQAKALIDRQVEMGARCVTLVITGGGLTPGTDPSSVELDPVVIQAATDRARLHGCQVIGRCHASDGMRVALEVGVDTIEHASFLVRGVTRFDEGLARDIVRAGVSIGPTVFGSRQAAARYRVSGPANPADSGAVARLEARLDNALRWHRLGARFAAGSSAGSIDVPPWGVVEETIIYVDIGLEPAAALRASTHDAARVLGLPVGAVAVGRAADLLLVDADPLEDITALRQPSTVISRGRRVETA